MNLIIIMIIIIIAQMCFPFGEELNTNNNYISKMFPPFGEALNNNNNTQLIHETLKIQSVPIAKITIPHSYII